MTDRQNPAPASKPGRRHLTLRARLALWYGGAVALTGLLLVAITTAAATAAVLISPAEQDSNVSAAADQIMVLLADLDPAGTTPPTDSATPTDTASPTDAATIGATGAQATNGETGVLYDDLRAAVSAENNRIRSQVLRSVLTWSVAALILVAVLAVVFGWVIASRALAPLRLMAATAHRVAGDNLGERIALDGPNDEVKDLADTVDAMLERLDRSFDAQRRFVANASHELRTPLTINRTVLEVALADPDASTDLQDVGRSLLEVNARHERLIDGLLTLATADRGPELTDDVDLADLVEIATSRALPGAGSNHEASGKADRAPRLRLDVDAAVVVTGNELLLERLMQNLVDNAVRYNVEGGFVEVRLAADGDCAVLSVTNPGPIVPAADAESLFEPFRRLDHAGRDSDRSAGYIKGGIGLGLSIVRSVARAHGGTATATPRPGGGLTVTVRLPLPACYPTRCSHRTGAPSPA